MSFNSISEALDVLVEPFADNGDWNAIVAEAGRSTGARSRKPTGRIALIAAAVLLAALLATPAFGIVSRIRDLFTGTPATQAVINDFQSWNAVSGWHPTRSNGSPAVAAAAESQLVATFPAVDPQRAHGILAVQLSSSATYYLWAAPLESGGECAILQSADAQGNEQGNSWGSGESWCVTATSPAGVQTFGQYGRPTNHDLRVLPGKAPGSSSVKLQFADGSTRRSPVVEGFFLTPLDGAPQSPGTTVTHITSYDSDGNLLAEKTFP
jgi:hypothetical protein